jgi:hypothetical protein
MLDDLGATLAALDVCIAKLALAADNLEDVQEGTHEILLALEVSAQLQLALIQTALAAQKPEIQA